MLLLMTDQNVKGELGCERLADYDRSDEELRAGIPFNGILTVASETRGKVTNLQSLNGGTYA
jgi:hypothetical protein